MKESASAELKLMAFDPHEKSRNLLKRNDFLSSTFCIQSLSTTLSFSQITYLSTDNFLYIIYLSIYPLFITTSAAELER